MLKKILYFSALSLVIVACAGSNVAPVKDGTSEDLVESFNLKDEKFKNFEVSKKVKKVKKSPKGQMKAKTTAKLKDTLKTPKKPKRVKSAQTTDQKKSKPQSKVIKGANEEQEPIVVEIKPEEKEDYPKRYKKYNQDFQKHWKEYQPVYFNGEEFKFEVSWSLFKAGTVTIETIDDLVIDEREVVGFKTVLRSAKYFENIYTLKDTLNSYVDKTTRTPVKFIMEQRESGQSVDDLQLFDSKELKTYFLYKRLKKGKTTKKNKESYIPRYFNDSFSALQFLRGLPMKVGNKFEFPVVTRTKVWLLKAKVDKLENIEVMGKKVSAYKIKAETHFPGVLKKRGDIVFWYSSDETRKLLKFEAKIKIGSVKGILIDYKEGSKK